MNYGLNSTIEKENTFKLFYMNIVQGTAQILKAYMIADKKETCNSPIIKKLNIDKKRIKKNEKKIGEKLINSDFTLVQDQDEDDEDDEDEFDSVYNVNFKILKI